MSPDTPSGCHGREMHFGQPILACEGDVQGGGLSLFMLMEGTGACMWHPTETTARPARPDRHDLDCFRRKTAGTKKMAHAAPQSLTGLNGPRRVMAEYRLLSGAIQSGHLPQVSALETVGVPSDALFRRPVQT